MKKIISLILLVILLLPMLTVSKAEEKVYESEFLPPGKFIFTTFGYHDTWTNGWTDWGNELTRYGTLNPTNRTRTWDKGTPGNIVQGSGNTIGWDAGDITSEEFKKKYRIVPLNRQALGKLGFTEEQANEIIRDALGNADHPSNMGLFGETWLEKYEDMGVTDWNIDYSKITYKNETITIPQSYRISTPLNSPNLKYPNPYGESLTDLIMRPSGSIQQGLKSHKDNGGTYEEWRDRFSQFYLMSEKNYKGIYNTGLSTGVVGWRWYRPYAVYQIETLKDLNVPDMSITIDNGGEITCEVDIENSFTDNLKRVQFVWELETPAGTVVYKLTE